MKNTVILDVKSARVTLKAEGRDITILQDIDVSFEKARAVAIVGPSGSGKTTLMMVCAGLQSLSAGELHFDGRKLPVDDEAQMTAWRQKNVGIVFQNFHLLPTSTALENVMLPLELDGRKDAEAAATAMLTDVGLSHRLHHLPSQLSGGEQQRVAIARALAVRPAILLADEPTGNLDSKTGQKIIDLLFEKSREAGTSLILITHDEKIAASCDQIISLQDGRVSAHAVNAHDD